MPTCKSDSRNVVLCRRFSKLPVSQGREQIQAWTHPLRGLPNELVNGIKPV